MRIIRLPAVSDRTGLKRSAIYKYMSQSKFPKTVSLGESGRVGWLEHEIDEWILACVKERDALAS